MSVLEVAAKILIPLIRRKVPDDLQMVGDAVAGVVEKWESGELGNEAALASLAKLDDLVQKDRELARAELRTKWKVEEP